MARNNYNIVYSCNYHIVWCTKYRKKLFVNPFDIHLKRILHTSAREYRCTILELEVMPDHVHLLVEVDPQFGVARLIKLMIGRSSHAMRDLFPVLKKVKTLWTNSYYISTVGGAPLEIVKKYIRNQKYAASKKTFYRKK